MKSSLARFAAVFLLAVPASNWAAHPYVTDDTGTQGTGKWQTELMAEHDRNARTADPGGGAVHQVRKVTLFNPVLTYGVLDTLDIAAGVSHLRQRTTEDAVGTQSAEGTGDSTLELKWRFYEANGLSLALKPGLVLPTGDENRGLGTGRLSWGVNFILTREAKPWVLLAEVAYARATSCRRTRRQTASTCGGPRPASRITCGTTCNSSGRPEFEPTAPRTIRSCPDGTDSSPCSG